MPLIYKKLLSNINTNKPSRGKRNAEDEAPEPRARDNKRSKHTSNNETSAAAARAGADDDKQKKKAQIIQKKRMMRKNRKGGA